MSCNTHERPERTCPFCFDSLAKDYETLVQQRNDLLKVRDAAFIVLQEKVDRSAADERARIVTWLRTQRDERTPDLCADLIERGEHTKVTQCAGCGHPLGDMGCCDLCDDEDAPSTS